MNDAEFLKHLEAGELHDFPHRAHIRMAWLYLQADGFTQGSTKIRATLLQLLEKHGAVGKYHETITQFWIYLVAHAFSLTPEIEDFEAFMSTHAHLLDSRLLKAHYSPERLSQSRERWATPDLQPLPGGEFTPDLR